MSNENVFNSTCVACKRKMGFFTGKIILKDKTFICNDCWKQYGLNKKINYLTEADQFNSEEILKIIKTQDFTIVDEKQKIREQEKLDKKEKQTCKSCGKEFVYDFSFEGGQRLRSGEYICSQCCAEMNIPTGMKGSIIAKKYDAVSFFKEYTVIDPSKKPLWDEAVDKEIAIGRERAKEIDAMKKEREKKLIRKNCNEKHETQYTCTMCSNIWYVDDTQVLLNVANALHGTIYSLNQMKNPAKCPKCGSTASKHKDVTIWIDKEGNCIDKEIK